MIPHSELSPFPPEAVSSTLGGPEHKMDCWLEPGWQLRAPHAARQLPGEQPAQPSTSQLQICSCTHHSSSVPSLLTEHPLRLLLSFSSFLKVAASQESPAQHGGPRQPALLHSAICPSSPRYRTCTIVMWLCHALILLQHPPVHSSQRPALVPPTPKRGRRENERGNDVGRWGRGLRPQ